MRTAGIVFNFCLILLTGFFNIWLMFALLWMYGGYRFYMYEARRR